jgi:hypothetical protein
MKGFFYFIRVIALVFFHQKKAFAPQNGTRHYLRQVGKFYYMILRRNK